MKPTLIINDGGRASAGYQGRTGDCVCRAIAIAANRPYEEIYSKLNLLAQDERVTSRMKRRSSARTGVDKKTSVKLIDELGGEWTAYMTIGSGCKVHLTPDELPKTGRYILQLSKHLAAWIDGQLHDTYDCSRDGTRCVYGVYHFPETK